MGTNRSGRDADGEGSDLLTELENLSAQAFRLAESTVGTGDFESHATEARQVSDRLDVLWPIIEREPAETRGALERYWSDARLDIGYVLSDGELDPSPRLFHLIQDSEEFRK